MYIEMIHPTSLSPEALDAYLERGWYRMGQAVFTCRFVTFGGILYPTIWIRLPLASYTFRKSLRRRMRRNNREFTIQVGQQGALDAEKEALYQRYRAHFRGELAPSLEEALFDGDGRDIFDTRQVTIRDGDRLIAFSFFDLGRESLESIIGVYDPDYSRHSLGFHTMLLEIQHGKRMGLKYFYPGYVVPGYEAFDYKLRVGPEHLEFFHPGDDAWRPYPDLEDDQLPTARLRHGLEAVCDSLREQGVPAEMRIYPLYRSASLDSRLALCLKQPLFIECHPERAGLSRLIVTYDYEADLYALEFCLRVADLSDQFHSFQPPEDQPPPCLHLLQQVVRLAESSSPERIARTLLQIGAA
ncbi:MAG: GNAT family N-acetyltransferase [Myxococcota bacterium]